MGRRLRFDTRASQYRAALRTANRRDVRGRQEETVSRIITFDGEKAGKRFSMVRNAVLMSGHGKDARTRERIRKEARVLDALDSISVPKDPAAPDGDRDLQQFTGAPPALTLSEDDYKLVEDYLNTTPWLSHAARAAVDTQDWWMAAEKAPEEKKA